MTIPGLDRLGLRHLWRDHQRTLYRRDQNGVQRTSRADLLLFWGLPALVGLLSAYRHIRLTDNGAMLNGVAILTGGLFTLLVMIYGLQAGGGHPSPRSQLFGELVRETRANVAYATAVALTLTFALMVIGAVTPKGDAQSGLNHWLSAALLAATAHLGLVLLMVINRIRLAANQA